MNDADAAEDDATHDVTESSFDLAAAYAVATPDDNRRMYAAWSSTYDSGFLATHGYVYHESVVAALLDRSAPAGPVLDVGCGTGVVGIELRRRGVSVVDGVDISPEMLAVAATKTTDDDADAVYRNLIVADLTRVTEIAPNTYSAVVSAGTFTHGHLGPEPIDELLRIAAPGAALALGVNAEHFRSAGFDRWFRAAIDAGRVRDLEIVERPIYDAARYTADDADQHATSVSAVAVFTSGLS